MIVIFGMANSYGITSAGTTSNILSVRESGDIREREQYKMRSSKTSNPIGGIIIGKPFVIQ